MYSPKIKEDLIPILYRLAEEKHKTMTGIVDEILRPALVVSEESKAIPYCMSCYSKVETEGKQVTAYCNLCKSETLVLYTVPNNSEDIKPSKLRKEVI